MKQFLLLCVLFLLTACDDSAVVHVDDMAKGVDLCRDNGGLSEAEAFTIEGGSFAYRYEFRCGNGALFNHRVKEEQK